MKKTPRGKDKLTREEKTAKREAAFATLTTPYVEKRPSEYDPRYCQLILDIMSKGKSIAAFCVAAGIGRTTMQQWEARHPDFKVACDAAREASQLWWEDLGGVVASGAAAKHEVYKKANQGMIMFMMSRRFSDYYAKNRIAIDDKINQKDEVFSQLSKEERLALIARYKEILDELENENGSE